jgi:hypothetical protein
MKTALSAPSQQQIAAAHDDAAAAHDAAAVHLELASTKNDPLLHI